MQTLKGINLNKSLGLVEDFVRSVPAGNFDETLKGKKEQAESALNHMRGIFSDQHTEEGCCHAGQKSQTTHPPE